MLGITGPAWATTPGQFQTKIAADLEHSLALKSDGTVVAWGRNNAGQCDIPSDLKNVIAIDAGYYHSLALKNDGTVVAWGSNRYGQLDIPSGLDNVVAIAAGKYYSLALKSDGTVVAWGSNNSGQCNIPTGLNNVVAVSASYHHSLALKSDGTVVGWGDQCNIPSGLNNVVAISAGYHHSLALKSDGTMVAWGYNFSGQLNIPSGLNNVVAISVGDKFSLALKSDGTVVAWGDNVYGQCNIPAGLNNVVAIAAGEYHSLALKSDGTVVAWGDNISGQCNIPANLNLTPSTLTADPSIVAADGSTTSTITATLKDMYGSPLINKTVTLSQNKGASSQITPASTTTDVNGKAIFTVSNTKGETVTYTAITTTDNLVVPQTVQVQFFLSSAKDITGFTVPGQVGTSVIDATYNTVTFHMPYGTDVRSLTPTISISANATVSPTSGTSKDFSNPVIYTVTAQDNSAQDWTVKCIVAPNNAKDITGFTVPGQAGTSVIDATYNTISFHMPYGTDVRSLTPTISVSANATVSPTSGTSKNFTHPVIYTVTAQDNSAQNWTVKCIVAPNNAKDITGFTVPGQAGTSVIDATYNTISFHMPYGTDVRSLTPTISVSANATVSPTSGTSKDFTHPVIYTVTAQDNSTQDWTATCLVQQPNSPDLTSISPDHGLAGTSVTLSGSNFGSVAGSVYFQQANNQYIVIGNNWSDDSVQVTVPTSLSPGSVSMAVYNDIYGLTSNWLSFIVIPPAPTISPNGGIYTSSQNVILGNIPNGDTAYYTTDGTSPIGDSNALGNAAIAYSAPFTVSQTQTVKAAVYDSVGGWSSITSAAFTITASSDSGGTGSGSTVTLQPVSTTTGSATVSPSVGGTLSLGNSASINIPAEALQGSADVNVKIQVTPLPPAAPEGYSIIGAYKFTLNGQDHYTFNRPVTLTFHFDPSKVATGTSPAVYYHDGTKWVLVSGTVDWTNDIIKVMANHFSEFAVMAQNIEQSTTTATTWKDVAGNWAEKNIEKLVSMNAISGYPDGTFRPDNTVTRAEFVSLLVRAFKLPPQNGRVFADTKGQWAQNAIATATYYEIASGIGNDKFGSNDLITREQIAAMIVKAAKLNTVTGDIPYTDTSDISGWAHNAVVTALKEGIIHGYPDNTLRPQAPATRAEAVTIIVNALNK